MYSDEVEHTVTELNDYQIKEYLKTPAMSDEKSGSTSRQEVQPSEPAIEKKSPEPSVSAVDTPVSQSVGEVEGKCSFTCGNPDAQTIHGIMHFFNDFSKCESRFYFQDFSS